MGPTSGLLLLNFTTGQGIYGPKSIERGFNFDSEYNLMSLIGDKELAKKEICVNGQKLRVRPDFLIHGRGKKELNFLWVEMKKRGGEDWEDDLNRLVGVTREAHEEELSCVMGYAYGLGVLFHKRKVRCMWYEKGHLLKNFYGRISKQGHWTWKECTGNDSGVGND